MSDLTDSLHLGVVEYEKRWSGDCHADKGGPVDYDATLKIMVEAADRIADLQAENTALKDQLAGKWLPIESAPTDGRKIMINHNGKVHVGMWRNRGGWLEGWYCTHGTKRSPTHWMPLPPAPKGPDA